MTPRAVMVWAEDEIFFRRRCIGRKARKTVQVRQAKRALGIHMNQYPSAVQEAPHPGPLPSAEREKTLRSLRSLRPFHPCASVSSVVERKLAGSETGAPGRLQTGGALSTLRARDQTRNREVLQSWEATAGLVREMAGGNTEENLARCESALTEAASLYTRLAAAGIRLDARSNSEHLEPIREGIQIFKELAEL